MSNTINPLDKDAISSLIDDFGKSIAKSGESQKISEEYIAQKNKSDPATKAQSLPQTRSGDDVKKIEGREKADTQKSEEEIKHKTLEEAMSELNELTGMKEVKAQINELTQLVKVNKLRKEQGIDGAEVSYHLLFLGNPGTGKSTVSRIVADIYWNLGVVKKGQLIETERAKIVKGYVGQTAKNMLDICETARGGVLVIDEAYSLANKGENDYGHEALETLLKFMEDNREDIVVIACGYTKEMQLFIASNSGIKSRFSNFIDFDNYTPEECLQILDKMLKKYQIELKDDKLRKVLLDFFGIADNDPNFANARAVRNLEEYIIAIQSTRLGEKGDRATKTQNEILYKAHAEPDDKVEAITKKDLTTVILEDIKKAIDRYWSINREEKENNG
ncbi:hypothetical protein FACS1894125_6270 [Actinomycetota bacterium]|nr:hypothetical protein FACS1894125_6270 [Actinomycetota bacterium]